MVNLTKQSIKDDIEQYENRIQRAKDDLETMEIPLNNKEKQAAKKLETEISLCIQIIEYAYSALGAVDPDG